MGQENNIAFLHEEQLLSGTAQERKTPLGKTLKRRGLFGLVVEHFAIAVAAVALPFLIIGQEFVNSLMDVWKDAKSGANNNGRQF